MLNYQVVVVDNRSTDGSLECLQQWAAVDLMPGALLRTHCGDYLILRREAASNDSAFAR